MSDLKKNLTDPGNRLLKSHQVHACADQSLLIPQAPTKKHLSRIDYATSTLIILPDSVSDSQQRHRSAVEFQLRNRRFASRLQSEWGKTQSNNFKVSKNHIEIV